MLYLKGEWKLRMSKLLSLAQDRFRDGDHPILVGTGGIDENQFADTIAFRVILGLSSTEPYVAFDLEKVRGELTQEKQD